MLFKRLVAFLPWAAILLFAWVLLHALSATSAEYRQWPRRLARFLFALLAGVVIFALIYLTGGLLISGLGYTFQDKPLLRLAHLICVLSAYPAGMAAGSIFRTKHTTLILGILLALGVHLCDHGSYLGRMVFADSAIPLNGDFSLTNMALMLVTTIIGGEVGLRLGIKSSQGASARHGTVVEPPAASSLTSEGG